MERHNLFTTHQHGFRKGRYCVTQLIEVLDDWTEQLENPDAIDTIYLDFQKAFATVPHQRLINKLQSYGICGYILGWIRDSLANRKQKVVINGTGSDWPTVTIGIPKGSVIGPILVTIYINDLPDVVHNIAKLFADDTKVYTVVNKEEEQHSLQNDINNLVHWSDKWLLKFNKSKCKHVHLGHATNKKHKMGENEINLVTEEKNLGILIDDKLKFQQHINQQKNKANQRLGMIKRSFSYMDKEMFLTLFKSIVKSHLEYGRNVWYVIYKKEAMQIGNVQRRATKLVNTYTTSELHSTLEIYWIAITSIQKAESRHD
jgi:hypothetical protein